ncbi:PREDICTED: serine/threonine-protein phosphatase 7 long form homolog [Erythranthe guttata]|uniref:serine/threonine-protein phosphatase 7 long form homolog n=1 Tax=Erythranthe guttata TaxID=4155 RepID=UPI00064DB947|nr:PREDICTED: serine/threonine-protein phosphatase 7 long form homolog [Erythranthe guttata]|eukprot:XP_012857562.1 PREDICTED: serine/threonine-protein phosphatase 7 long form homolog [Erythranthe guttata]
MSVVQASYNTVDGHLLRAFIERWQPATNTFHLPVGEMTITLDDVSTLVGLPVVGRTVSCERLIRDSKTKPSSLMFELLGEYPDDVNKKKAVKLEWLKAKFSKVTMRDSAEKRTYAIRAYLLFLLGCTILCDKTGNMVSVEYLNLVSDLDRIGEYAWGTACLCRLYDELSSASQKSTNSMAGWLTLFQSWIYEHFPYLAGGTLKTEFEGPLANRWEPQSKTTSTPERASYLRSRLDDLIPDQVLWSPYTAIRDRFPMPDSAWFSGMICCMDHFEAYHPDRVLRQFNRVQIIPGRAYMSKDMYKALVSKGRPVQNSIFVAYGERFSDRWEEYCLDEESRSVEVELGEADTSPDYMNWFRPRCMLQLSRHGAHPPRPQADRPRPHEARPGGGTNKEVQLSQILELVKGTLSEVRGLAPSDAHTVMWGTLNDIVRLIEPDAPLPPPSSSSDAPPPPPGSSIGPIPPPSSSSDAPQAVVKRVFSRKKKTQD